MPRVRLAVALLLPPPLAAEIDGLRRACDDPMRERVPAHVTLVPPVNVHDDRRADAADVLAGAAARTRPFPIDIGPAASFAPATPVLYLAVSGDSGALAALRERVLAGPLARRLDRPFVPHVTIGSDLPAGRLDAGVRALAGYRTGCTVDRLHLLEERPGRVWEPAGEYPFGGPATVGRGGLPVALTVSATLDADARAFAAREWPAAGATGRQPVVVTARRDGEVVGLADGWVRGDVAFLDGLLVGAAVRGEGIGRHLLAAFEAACAERGCREVWCEAVDPAFYERRGWRVAGESAGRVLLRRPLTS